MSALDWLEAADRHLNNRSITLSMIGDPEAELFAAMNRLGAKIRREKQIGWDGRPYRGTAARRSAPTLHATKGYRGAHKLFRGGSR